MSVSLSVPTQYRVKTPHRQVELRSERGVDYTKLRDLLVAQKWKEADQETAKVMLKAVGRKNIEQGWLIKKDIDHFPYEYPPIRTENK